MSAESSNPYSPPAADLEPGDTILTAGRLLTPEVVAQCKSTGVWFQVQFVLHGAMCLLMSFLNWKMAKFNTTGLLVIHVGSIFLTMILAVLFLQSAVWIMRLIRDPGLNHVIQIMRKQRLIWIIWLLWCAMMLVGQFMADAQVEANMSAEMAA